MIKQFKDEPVTTWEPDELVVATTDVPPACAACEQLPKKDCDNPACAFRGSDLARF